MPFSIMKPFGLMTRFGRAMDSVRLLAGMWMELFRDAAFTFTFGVWDLLRFPISSLGLVLTQLLRCVIFTFLFAVRLVISPYADRITKRFRTKTQGRSLVNCVAPLFGPTSKGILNAELERLSTATDSRSYDPNFAKAMLLMSAAAYEEGSKPEGSDVQTLPDIAHSWNLEVEIVANADPCRAVLFYSVSEKLIICAFKGTTPHNLEEWVCDSSITKVNASEMLDGRAHKGFYTALFERPNRHDYIREQPTANAMLTKQSRRTQALAKESEGAALGKAQGGKASAKREPLQLPSGITGAPDFTPYVAIVETIKSLARHIRTQPTRTEEEKVPSNSEGSSASARPVSLWITGHSLGGALASLLYARLMKAPADICDEQEDTPTCVLRGAYTFGAPRVGSQDFASAYASARSTPLENRKVKMWRVVHGSDIVTEMPFGFDTESPLSFRYERSNLLFDFRHVGERVHVRRSPPPKDLPWRITGIPKVIADLWRGNEVEPELLVRLLLPKTVQDHIPAFYLRGMERSSLNTRTSPNQTGTSPVSDQQTGSQDGRHVDEPTANAT